MCVQILDTINGFIQIISFVILLYATYYVPKKIMNNQIYADLIAEYRSTTIGSAIIFIIRFYVIDCSSNVLLIKDKYVERYNKEIDNKKINIENTLHFQRRVLSQYYWQLSSLRFNGFFFGRLSKRSLKKDFSVSDSKLLYILYYMNIAAKDVQIDFSLSNTIIQKQETSKVNSMIEKLFIESKNWK